uniref:Uncharacterized protein n=1 Tax=Arundo donax TaxID=35708 RepID=A0A0A9D4Y5_ARUDO
MEIEQRTNPYLNNKWETVSTSSYKHTAPDKLVYRNQELQSSKEQRTCPYLQTYMHKKNGLLNLNTTYFAENLTENLGVALPLRCWHAVQVVAPVAAIVPILSLEKHHQ